MATYYDRLNEFFAANEFEPISASAQLIFLHLLHENNRLGNIGSFRYSDVRLATVTGLSRQTITTAKRTLKTLGFIDFKTEVDNPRAGTVYTLPELNLKPHKQNDGRRIENIGAEISDEIRKAWKLNNDGVFPNETEIFYLANDIKLHGEENVKQAINRAGQKKRGSLSIYFYKMQLTDIICGKEGAHNVRGNIGGVNSQYRGFGVDKAPAD